MILIIDRIKLIEISSLQDVGFNIHFLLSKRNIDIHGYVEFGIFPTIDYEYAKKIDILENRMCIIFDENNQSKESYGSQYLSYDEITKLVQNIKTEERNRKLEDIIYENI